MAAENDNAVYVFNRGTVSGVMLTQEQFEGFVRHIEALEDMLAEAEAARRIADTTIETYTDTEVRGKRSASAPRLDAADGWQQSFSNQSEA
jgi:hypothetical protein